LLATGCTACCSSVKVWPSDKAHGDLSPTANTTEALKASITLAYFTLTALPGFHLGASTGGAILAGLSEGLAGALLDSPPWEALRRGITFK
jgi:hypothetical protein